MCFITSQREIPQHQFIWDQIMTFSLGFGINYMMTALLEIIQTTDSLIFAVVMVSFSDILDSYY